MAWVPSTTLLGTVTEFETFSYNIQYYVPGTPADPLAIPPVEAGSDTYYRVDIIPSSEYSTVTVTDGTIGTPIGTIAGYFQYVFNDTLVQKNRDGSTTTLTGDATTGAWAKLDLDNLYEMTSFQADPTRFKTLSYTVRAMDGSTVLDTQTYTIDISDPNWDTGKANLHNAVSTTTARNVG